MNWKINNNSKYKKILDNAKEEKRATIHSFHRYYGKLIPAIPNAFIKEFTNEGDLISDLFSGSGTVAVESKILNRDFIGCEINPLSHLISIVKTTSYDIELLNSMNDEIEAKLYDVQYRKKIKIGKVPYCVNIDHWFKPEVQDDLMYIKAIIDEVISNNVQKYLCYKDINSLLKTLDKREEDIIKRRFGIDGNEPNTLEQIGNSLGFSKERIRQLENLALQKLRRAEKVERLKTYLEED